jgi:NAD(P)-dependent dehydrogenase (short-subunit alcohol dehydrogenase family)
VVNALTGRHAIVAGGAGGIGSAVVLALREQGAHVAVIDRAAAPGVLQADLTRPAEVDQAVQAALTQLGCVDTGLDIVVNAAGGSGRSRGDGPVHQIPDEAWDFVLDMNLRSTFLVCRAVVPHCAERASIVNISSVLGLTGGAPDLFDAHAYAAAKGGVIALSRAMATAYASKGIRVNVVAPGLVRTPMSARAQESPAVQAEAVRRQPLSGAFLEPSAVATAVAFLASDAAAAVTGVVLPVDAGWTAT